MIVIALSCSLALVNLYMVSVTDTVLPDDVKSQRTELLNRCKYIKRPAGPSDLFYSRSQSDRFVLGTKPVLLRNAKIWTGARNGTEMIFGDIFLDKGLVKAIGYIPPNLLENGDFELYDVQGAWVTPGIVDLHSHIGVDALPALRGLILLSRIILFFIIASLIRG